MESFASIATLIMFAAYIIGRLIFILNEPRFYESHYKVKYVNDEDNYPNEIIINDTNEVLVFSQQEDLRALKIYSCEYTGCKRNDLFYQTRLYQRQFYSTPERSIWGYKCVRQSH